MTGDYIGWLENAEGPLDRTRVHLWLYAWPTVCARDRRRCHLLRLSITYAAHEDHHHQDDDGANHAPAFMTIQGVVESAVGAWKHVDNDKEEEEEEMKQGHRGGHGNDKNRADDKHDRLDYARLSPMGRLWTLEEQPVDVHAQFELVYERRTDKDATTTMEGRV